ncbi:uncharacterized protein LOC115071832 [Nannospalax galili]|uniref:uncharacterized protein LOC115071832 n=1 Tax=Nannospalax galili TaxID=1026970 RepID=UPI00111C0D5B|nr:uncharacterized protein LOC115071832 [Nannospalax galili]
MQNDLKLESYRGSALPDTVKRLPPPPPFPPTANSSPKSFFSEARVGKLSRDEDLDNLEMKLNGKMRKLFSVTLRYRPEFAPKAPRSPARPLPVPGSVRPTGLALLSKNLFQCDSAWGPGRPGLPESCGNPARKPPARRGERQASCAADRNAERSRAAGLTGPGRQCAFVYVARAAAANMHLKSPRVSARQRPAAQSPAPRSPDSWPALALVYFRPDVTTGADFKTMHPSGRQQVRLLQKGAAIPPLPTPSPPTLLCAQVLPIPSTSFREINLPYSETQGLSHSQPRREAWRESGQAGWSRGRVSQVASLCPQPQPRVPTGWESVPHPRAPRSRRSSALQDNPPAKPRRVELSSKGIAAAPGA